MMIPAACWIGQNGCCRIEPCQRKKKLEMDLHIMDEVVISDCKPSYQPNKHTVISVLTLNNWIQIKHNCGRCCCVCSGLLFFFWYFPIIQHSQKLRFTTSPIEEGNWQPPARKVVKMAAIFQQNETEEKRVESWHLSADGWGNCGWNTNRPAPNALPKDQTPVIIGVWVNTDLFWAQLAKLQSSTDHRVTNNFHRPIWPQPWLLTLRKTTVLLEMSPIYPVIRDGWERSEVEVESSPLGVCSLR